MVEALSAHVKTIPRRAAPLRSRARSGWSTRAGSRQRSAGSAKRPP